MDDSTCITQCFTSAGGCLFNIQVVLVWKVLGVALYV